MAAITVDAHDSGNKQIHVQYVSIEVFEKFMHGFTERGFSPPETHRGTIYFDEKTELLLYCHAIKDYPFMSEKQRAINDALDEEFIASFPPPPEGDV